MSGKTAFFIELILVHGGVLAWAIWELTSLRRSQAKDRALKASALQSVFEVKEKVHHSEHSDGTKDTTRPGPQILH